MTVEARSEQGTTPPAAQEKAIAVDLAAQIGDLDVAWRLATALAQSNLMPEALRNRPSDVLVTMMWGRDLGFSPMQAIQAIYVVNGRPTLGYQGWLAKAREAGHKVRFVEHTDTVCTVQIIRHDDPDEPVSATFTIEDAQRAGLAQKDIWKKYPRNMLGGRAIANACRLACPEVALGFFTEDEADEISGPQAPKPTLAAAAAQRAAATAAPTPDPDSDVEDAELVDDDPGAKDVANAAAVAALAAEHSTTGTATSTPVDDDPDADDRARDEGEPDPRDEEPANVEWPEVTPPGSGLPDELFGDEQ